MFSGEKENQGASEEKKQLRDMSVSYDIYASKTRSRRI